MANAGRRYSGGSCCCGNCDIGSDTFDGDLSQWTITGTAVISSGELAMTQGAVALFTPAPATDGDAVKVSAIVEADSLPATIRLLVGVVDASNGLYGELDIDGSGNATLVVGELEGGSANELADPVDFPDVISGAGTLSVCWSPGDPAEELDLQTGYRWPTSAGQTGGWDDGDGDVSALTAQGGSATQIGGGNSTLSGTGYGFAVPVGSTITGVSVSITANADFADHSQIADVDLYLNGVLIGTKAPNDLIGTTPTPFGYGGDADLWGATITDDDVNSFTFGATVHFEQVDFGNTPQLTASDLVINVYYTSPDRSRGILRVHYLQGSTGECASAFKGFSDGTGTGVSAVLSNWDVDNYTLTYGRSLTRPSCPACDCVAAGPPCTCCTDTPPESVRVTIDGSALSGTGGCSLCNTVDGDYIIDAVDACIWEYFEAITCTVDGDPVAGTLMIRVQKAFEVGRDCCFWRVTIHISTDAHGTTILDPSDPARNAENALSIVIWESACELTCTDFPIDAETDDTVADIICGDWPAIIEIGEA